MGNTATILVGDTAPILAFLFNYALRKSHEGWASQFPFLYIMKVTLPPIEACLMVASIGVWLKGSMHLGLACHNLQFL